MQKKVLVCNTPTVNTYKKTGISKTISLAGWRGAGVGGGVLGGGSETLFSAHKPFQKRRAEQESQPP